MIDEILGRIFINQRVVLFTVTVMLLALAHLGFRLGLISRKKNPEAAASHGGSVQGAVLGLLGLLLGFSFAMAVGRYEARRELVLNEANSIGTTWLRADFLPSPQGEEVKSLLVRYTKLRIDGFAKADSPEALAAVSKETSEIHNVLWAKGAAAAKTNPSPLATSFITSLNETIDLDASRLAARRNHVPGAVWLLLLLVSGSSAWASGYGSGVNGSRSLFNQIVFPLLIGIVITLITDIDRPNKGIVGISQAPLQDVLKSIEPSQP